MRVFLGFALFLFSVTSQAWVNEVFFIRGKIRSYDRKWVQIEAETKMIAHVPRNAIPEKFKIAALSTIVSVPVFSQRASEVKWKSPKVVRLAQLHDEQDEIFKEMDQEYQRLLKARRNR